METKENKQWPVGFGETYELQSDGSHKLIQITRIQCSICGEIGWREPDEKWLLLHSHKEDVNK